MKYCKRCFRNITEDVAVCPYCKQSDKLIDYDKEKRGEDFTCNDNSTFSSHKGRGDAYDTSESDADADNAYGNEKRHSLENCENAAEAPEMKDPGTPGENFSKIFTYLRTLTPEQRQKIMQQTADDIQRTYGSSPDEGSTVKLLEREITVAQFNRLAEFFNRLNTAPAKDTTSAAKNFATVFSIWLIVTVLFPPVGIIFAVAAIAIFLKKKNNNNDNNNNNNRY